MWPAGEQGLFTLANIAVELAGALNALGSRTYLFVPAGQLTIAPSCAFSLTVPSIREIKPGDVRRQFRIIEQHDLLT